MAIKDTADAHSGSSLSWLYQKPYMGLVIWGTVLLWKPIAHTVVVSERLIFPGNSAYLVGALLGLVGFVLVWIGFKKDELTASALGWMGGALIWLGWFESAFHFFAHLLNIQPVKSNGFEILSAELQIIEASAVLYIATLIFLGLNKDTRCRMFLWFHRNAKLKPETPTPGYRRQYSRITALETVFISWFFYIFIILLFDPRIFGPQHFVTVSAFWGALIWGLYLMAFKMPNFSNAGEAIRYAIPSTGIIWLCFEMASAWGWYQEIWLKPIEFPVSNIVFALVFIAFGTAIVLNSNRGLLPKARKTA